MAAEAKKGGVKQHVKSISAPATPQRPGSGTPEHRIAAEHEKPIPSYLRPTISSCRNTSRQSPPPDPVTTTSTTTTKSLVSKKPKAPSSSQLKERTTKPSSPLPKPSKAKSPMLSKSQSFSRATTSRTKRILEAKQHHVAPPTLLESKSFSGVTATSTKKKYANREERRVLPTLAEAAAELKNQLGTISKRKAEVVRGVNSNEEKMTSGATRVVRQAGGHEGKRVVLLKRRESSQPYINEVIEETANKLAERRRNKVLALVGAFETVISLQEPEGQPSPKVDSREKEKEGDQEEEVNKLDCGSDDRQGEKTNVNVGGIVDQDMEENNVDDGRTQIRIRADEKMEVQGDEQQEAEKKVENETEATKSTTGVEECYRVGNESQQQREEMESTESTDELTESTTDELTESTTEEEDKGSELTVHATEEEKNASWKCE